MQLDKDFFNSEYPISFLGDGELGGKAKGLEFIHTIFSEEIAAVEKANTMGKPVRNYASEGPKHYHQFVDACLGKDECSAPFSYASRLTETILLGVIANRFPNQTLNWDSENAKFSEEEANNFLEGDYRDF